MYMSEQHKSVRKFSKPQPSSKEQPPKQAPSTLWERQRCASDVKTTPKLCAPLAIGCAALLQMEELVKRGPTCRQQQQEQQQPHGPYKPKGLVVENAYAFDDLKWCS